MGPVLALVPAHNEEASIEATVRALREQSHRLDRVVVIADNCADATASLASQAGAEVLTTVGNTDKKVGALTLAWQTIVEPGSYDLVVFVDADTVLDQHAVRDWVADFEDPELGGCSARFTMLPNEDMSRWGRFLTRLQKFEFALWTSTALKRDGKTTVLAGTSCAIRTEALRQVAERPDRVGPWTTASAVEDFELSYRLRRLGWQTRVSYTARAYTDSMTTIQALWGQRMKWQMGTVQDLLTYGVNRYTLRDWGQQAMGLVSALIRVSWIALIVVGLTLGVFQWDARWLLVPVLFVALDIKRSLIVPARQRVDIVQAAMLIPQEFFAWLRAAWFFWSWMLVLTGSQRDLWSGQYQAERG